MTLQFNKLWASAASRIAWSESTVTGGWTSRIPRYQYDNNFLYEQHDKLWYKRQNGISEWSENDDISKYDIVLGSDKEYYVAKQDSGPWTTTGLGTNGTTTDQTSVGSIDPVNDSSLTYWVHASTMGTVGEVKEFAFSNQQEVDALISSGWKLLDGQNGSLDVTGLALSGSEIDGARINNVGSITLSFNTTTTIPELNNLHTHQVDGYNTTLNINNLPDHDHYFVDKPPAYDPNIRPFVPLLSWSTVLSYSIANFASGNVGYTSGVARATATNGSITYGDITRYSFWNEQNYPNGKPTSSHNHLGGVTSSRGDEHEHTLNISGEIVSDHIPKNIKLMLFEYVGF